MHRDNPSELNRILNLSPIRAIAELGKMEAKLSKEPEKKVDEKPVSKAPAPITIVSGQSTTVQKDPKDMTFRELRDYERQREAEKRARR